jgi:hypothetical protein
VTSSSPQPLSPEQWRTLVEAGVIGSPVELINGVVFSGEWRLAVSPAQRDAAAQLGIALPPDETTEERAARLAERSRRHCDATLS